jgi:hypothetical protein
MIQAVRMMREAGLSWSQVAGEVLAGLSVFLVPILFMLLAQGWRP